MQAVDILYLSQEDVQGLGLSSRQLTEVVENALLEHADHMVEMPPRTEIHPGYVNTFVHAMPAYLKRMDTCGMKWMAGFPRNAEQELPTLTGLIVLNDTRTGLPLAVLDGRWVTTMRSALVSALAVKHCVRPGPRTLAIIGCGQQGRHHARAITETCRTLSIIRFFDVHEPARQRFAAELKSFKGKLVGCADLATCVSGADIVATCTTGGAAFVENDWFAKGATGVGLEGASAWKPETLKAVDKFIVDDLAQVQALEARGEYPGGMPAVYGELGEIIAGRKPGRENNHERILITPAGLAIEDIALAKMIYDTARTRQVGTRLPLMRDDL